MENLLLAGIFSPQESIPFTLTDYINVNIQMHLVELRKELDLKNSQYQEFVFTQINICTREKHYNDLRISGNGSNDFDKV